MKLKRVLSIMLMAVVGAMALSTVSAQTVKSIKQQKAKTQREITETAKQIDKNKADTRRQLNQLNTITAEIGEQQRSIDALTKQLEEINAELQSVNDSIAANEARLQEMRDEYGKAIRKIHSHSSSLDKLLFVFQSASFHQALRRMRYLREFSAWQKRQSREIGEMQKRLEASRAHINALATTKSNNLKDQNLAKLTLEQKKRQQSDVVSKLKKEGKQLSSILAEKKKKAKALDEALDRLIEQERIAAEKARQKAEEERRKKGESQSEGKQQDVKPEKKEETKPKTKPKTPEKVDVALSGSFESNKGKLPFPVTGKYKIVSHFGVNKHPELKYVTTDNGGIDIETQPGAVAHAIYEGKVSAIFRQEGFNTVVMIRHGSYLTIYVNLSEIYVRTGEKVKMNQNIGKIYSDSEDGNRTILHFEIRKEKTKLNPEQWMRR
ncbi:MAG: murein hydrolase activator EnvC family protein [Muribaculaceae bacterium]